MNKENKTQPEIKEESKEKSFVPSIPKIKKQILRNHKNLKKIPSTNNVYTSSINKIKLAKTINYSSRKEKDSKESSLTNNTFQETKKNNVVSLKHIKKQFFTTHLILPKPFWLCSGTRIFDKAKNKNKNNSHKNTISEMASVNSILNNNKSKGNNSNNNTTANTHKTSNKKNISNSFKKCKINLKTLSRKNSYKNNNYTKIKKISNICPIRKILNRNNSNNSIIIKGEETKTNNYSFMSKTQFHYEALIPNPYYSTNKYIKKKKKNPEDEYTNDILYNLLQEEKDMKLKIDSDYFKTQPEINEKMRAILIDWLIDVNNKFNFTEETLYLAINIIDTYLSLKKIKRCNLQLLGVTALFISCKQNEIIFRRLKEYAYITDNAYNEQDILNMENDIFQTLEFNILFPSALTFFEILCHNFGILDKENKDDKKNLEFNLGKFLIESFYMSDTSLKYYASTIACSAMYIVMKFFKMKNYQVCYDKNLFNIKEKITKNNTSNIIKECAKEIYSFIGELSKNNLNASIRNFSNEKYGNITKLVFGNLPLN